MQRIASLRNQILKAKHAYYYSNTPIMTDSEYDSLEDELRLLSPNDPVLSIVGASVPSDAILTKAQHSIPMGSQSKVNSADEFRSWCAKTEATQIHASLKGDGASAAAYYKDGRLVKAISRGDGTIGEDITANAVSFRGLPAWAGTSEEPFTGAVRFEVILTIADWTSIDPNKSKNPRNAGTGIMGRKNGLQSNFLSIFAFDLDETREDKPIPFRTEEEKSVRLEQLGFQVMPYRLCDGVGSAVAYFKDVAHERENLPFWIDGVVMKINDINHQKSLGVTGGRPKGQVAWKFDSTGAETTIEGVIISGGHAGGLYPTAQLRPVDIGGSTISSASLANFDEIRRLDVAIGDSVWVIKANDIIPKIVRVTQRGSHRSPITPPTECPFCGGLVGRKLVSDGGEGVTLECQNPACSQKSTGKIKRWIDSLNILGIGDVVLGALVEQLDLKDPSDLYRLKNRSAEMSQLLINSEIDLRLGEKRSQAILAAIEASKNMSLAAFLGSLGIDHLGKRRVELIAHSSSGQLCTLEDWRAGKLRDNAIASQAGVPTIGSQIQDGIDACSGVIDSLLSLGVTAAPLSSVSVNKGNVTDRTVCITGTLPSGRKKSEYAQPLERAGYRLVDDVSRKLSFLVVADPDSTSSKTLKARKLQIPIVNEDELIRMLK